jgi:hypothetical protein
MFLKEVTFTEFIKELQNEVEFHKKGTNYRMVSAELSLQVANQEEEFSLFLNRNAVKKIVSQLQNVDFDRKNDVEKMLYTIARDLHRKATLPDEAKQYLQQKRQIRKPLQFIEKK